MNTLVNTASNCLLHSAFTTLFFEAWLKSLAVLALAGGLCWLLRRAAAATRHWTWLVAMVSLPCLLLLAGVPRSWQRPLWSVSTGFNSGNQFSLALSLAPRGEVANPAGPVEPARATSTTTGNDSPRRNPPIAARFSTTWLVVAVMVWGIGAALVLASVLAGQVQLVRLARKARPLQDPAWILLSSEACERLRLNRPVRLLQSVGNAMPLTWGWWRPVVLLPAEAAQWTADRRRVVLLHELAHVKRWDCLTQTVARAVCALYWLNPLVWLAARRMCVERERACDDLVLNSGCKASDYAAHLVDIARSFRRVPQLAGIAMARSPQIQGRVAAIVDASRPRRLRRLTALALFGIMGGLVLFVSGSCSQAPSNKTGESPLRQQQIAQIESFARAKEKQSRELAAKAGEQVPSEIGRFFQVATNGDWQTVTNLYMFCRQRTPKSGNGASAPSKFCRTAYWQPLLELDLAFCLLAECDPKYTQILADGIVNSVPAGSIYFGGTDPGRGVPTAFCKSQVDGDPFFTLTQNALADTNYLDYVRAMYSGKIYTPTAQDSQQCYDEYVTDAQHRLDEHKLRPGEDVRMVGGKAEVSGQVAVMSINGLLTRLIFDRNPDREFYVEESFPLEWMYPYLEPHGLIMKINRQPLPELPEDVVARDHEYWRTLVGGMLGDWLDDKTTVREVAEFVDRVYVRKNLKGFTGDPLFVQNDYATKTFCKLRDSIAGIYVWRIGGTGPTPYPPKSKAEAQWLIEEADFALRQSFALCPSSPEAVFRYTSFLLQQKRFDDALLVAETALKLDPGNRQFRGLAENIESYKKQRGGN
jgi:beta-lactamase regulating signal transducer with metallopeptidase domain